MIKLRYLILFMLLPCALSTFGQGSRGRRAHIVRLQKDTMKLKRDYMDSLLVYKRKIDSLTVVNDSLDKHASPDPRFFRLFGPLTFYYSAPDHALRLKGAASDRVDAEIDDVLMNMYIHYPYLVTNTEKRLQAAAQLREDIKTPIKHKIDFSEHEVPKFEEQPDSPLNIVVKKPNFWTYSGDYYLQFLQNFVSGNWYKGGESNYSMVGSAVMQANYNNKQKVKFENKLEMKLGFQTSRGDTLHSLKTSEDLLRYTGKLGLQATKRWYYTFQMIASTQFMRGYKSNDNNVYSDFLSPFNVNLSLGMSYSVSALGNKLTGSIQLAPLAYNFRYVGRKALATRYGLDEGKHTMNDFGSECTFDLTWVINNIIKWKTRLYGYTTYKRTEMEWENTISFFFNKYISSNIFIYPRFDDGSSKRDDHHGYWQFKEYASIGFAYSF